MKYMTPKEAAKKWGISQRRVHTLCKEGRINAVRHGWAWVIPEDEDKPIDARVKTFPCVQDNEKIKLEIDTFIPTAHQSTLRRSRLISKLAPKYSSLTYIHADAGYGKTTLLIQFAKERNDVIWFTLEEGDNDVVTFLKKLETEFRKKEKKFDFYSIDYIPFLDNPSFEKYTITGLLRAVADNELTLILDDVHNITDSRIIDLLIYLVKVCPQNLSIIIGSRHEMWSSLFRLKADGKVVELTKEDLLFNREEAEDFWGFFDEAAYVATEGWILAMQSYRIASENRDAAPIAKLTSHRNLNRYLLKEIFLKLTIEIQHFLKATSWLPRLEAEICNNIIDIDNAQEILDELVTHNIFTQQISTTSYRYHALFQSFLRKIDSGLGRSSLTRLMKECYSRRHYEEAADYALILEDENMLQDCIGALVENPFDRGRYRNLKKFFDFLDRSDVELQSRVLLAKGMNLSDRGDFYQAERCLNIGLKKLGPQDKTIYYYAMAHKARVLRNRVSYEESSRCIDKLLPLPEDTPIQLQYLIMIEKIHNLTMTSQLFEARQLTVSMMEKAMAFGASYVKAWFERYLTAIYFHMGDYKSCVEVYERSLSIPQEQQDWLMRHSAGAYAAKAYQVVGQEEKALPTLESELKRMQQLEIHEEFSIIYLLYAEILHATELLKLYRGKPHDFSQSYYYIAVAEEYALLNRSTRDLLISAQIWRLCAGLLDSKDNIRENIDKAIALIKDATPFFQSLAYGRIANAIDTLGINREECMSYFEQCIKIGEAVGSYAYAPLAYGRLANMYLQEGEKAKALEYTQHLMENCKRYNHKYYLRFKPLYSSVLRLAAEANITPEYTREILSYGGYAMERVYINTLGSFYIAPAHDRDKPIKIRTQKARELLAYLLLYPGGVARERIFSDLWGDSEANVPSLFHTRRGEIKKAFEILEAENPILNVKGNYRLSMEEIICDYDILQKATAEFKKESTVDRAQRVVDIYKGRYLDDMEALWAEGIRLSLEESFLEAAETLLESYRKSGEGTKALELLRRCKGLSHRGYHYEILYEQQVSNSRNPI